MSIEGFGPDKHPEPLTDKQLLDAVNSLTPTQMLENRLDHLQADLEIAIGAGDEITKNCLVVDLAWVEALQDLDVPHLQIAAIWVQKDVAMARMQEETEQDTHAETS